MTRPEADPELGQLGTDPAPAGRRPGATAAGAPTRLPLAARLLPGSVFYGWWIAVACAALMLVGVGVGYYGLAVFLRPLQETHGWSNAAVSGATGLYFAVGGVTAAVVGPVIDRRGPRRLMLTGSLILGGSVALVGLVSELWQLYVVYTALAVGFGMSSNVAVNAIISRWFVARRAQALAIAATGVSVGGVLIAPAGSALIDRGGLRLAGPFLGVLVVAVAIPVILLVLVWEPGHMGLLPDDGAAAPGVVRPALSESVQRRVWSRREAVRTASFWAVLVAFLLVLAAQTGLILHQLSFLEDRFGSRTRAAGALSITAAGSIVARLVVGRFADRLDKRALAAGLFVLQALAVLGLVATEDPAVTYALVLVVGFTIGNIYMVQTLLVAEIFGIVSFGTVFGLVSLASQVASGLGPFLVGLLEDRTGSYTAPLTLGALATLAAAVIVLFARPVEQRAAPPGA